MTSWSTGKNESRVENYWKFVPQFIRIWNIPQNEEYYAAVVEGELTFREA
jgi:hypothetical protein